MKRISWKLAIKFLGVFGCVVTFIVLAALIYVNRLEPMGMDIAFRDFCYRVRGEKWGFGYWFFRIITEFGNFYIISVIVVFIAIRTRCDFRAILLALGILFAVMLNIGLKGLYMRERPFADFRWMDEVSTSFPSGHSTAAGFMYSFLMYIIYHSKLKKSSQNILMGACLVLIPLVLFSRTILGVHYLSDVLAGFSVGIMVSCLCMLLYKVCVKYEFMTEGLLDKIKKNKE